MNAVSYHKINSKTFPFRGITDCSPNFCGGGGGVADVNTGRNNNNNVCRLKTTTKQENCGAGKNAFFFEETFLCVKCEKIYKRSINRVEE